VTAHSVGLFLLSRSLNPAIFSIKDEKVQEKIYPIELLLEKKIQMLYK
jgi:hypothetical protein